MVKDFRQKVLNVVRGIPKGTTASYKQVAAAAGRPGAARAVGNLMKANHDPSVPCHRVVRSDGRSGGYNRGAAAKIARLRSEGVDIVAGKVCART